MPLPAVVSLPSLTILRQREWSPSLADISASDFAEWEDEASNEDKRTFLFRTALRGLTFSFRSFGAYEDPPYLNAYSIAALRSTLWAGLVCHEQFRSTPNKPLAQADFFPFPIQDSDNEPGYHQAHFRFFQRLTRTLSDETALRHLSLSKQIGSYDADINDIGLQTCADPDIKFSGSTLLHQPLLTAEPPDTVKDRIPALLGRLDDGSDDPFWPKWYQGFLDGKPVDWELQRRIASEIDDADWSAGPAIVAQRIADIRKDFERRSLDQNALRSHAMKLTQSPVLHADIAESAGLQIQSAVQAYKYEAPANTLPDGFEAFESLVPTFLSISTTLRVTADDTPDVDALQAEINRLHDIVHRLRTDLRDARERLSDARLSALEAQQARTSGERAATFLTCVATTGVIASATLTFFGVPPEERTYEALKNALQGLSSKMENAQPSPDPPTLPETTSV